MDESDIEIVQDQSAVSHIFELMMEERKALGLIQHGERSDAWVVKVSSSRLILAKRYKATKFTPDTVELQFRCALGRNIVGKSRILRLSDEYLEIALPEKVAIIQRRHAYRVAPTADSIAIFQDSKKWILSGWIENLSATGILVRIPQTTPVVVQSDIEALWLQLNHVPPASELSTPGKMERSYISIKAATFARKADNGTTKFATYGIHFIPTLAEERQLAKMIVSYARAARQKGLSI